VKNNQDIVLILSDDHRHIVPRRKFLWLMSSLAASASLPWVQQAYSLDSTDEDFSQLTSPKEAETGTIDVVFRRTEDFALIRFRFRNAKWRDRHTIIARNQEGPLTVTALLSPQHLQEDVIPDSSSWGGAPVWAALSRPSRVVFEIPDRVFDFSKADLLDWQRLKWKERRVPPILPNSEIAEPGLDYTAVELPSALILSPDPETIWSPSAKGSRPLTTEVEDRTLEPMRKIQRAEWWHLRLISKTEKVRIESHDPTPLQSLEKAMIRAVWSDLFPSHCHTLADDPCPVTPPATVITALNSQDRKDIVTLSHDKAYQQTAATSADFDRGLDSRIALDVMALSSGGGWLNLIKHWDLSPLPSVPTTTLVGWTNKTALGRDSFVRKEYAAYLYPLGFHVVIVTTSYRETQLDPKNSSSSVAPLRQYVTLHFQDRAITNIDPHLVFSQISTDVLQTPHLTIPGWDPDNPEQEKVYWPTLKTTSAIYEFPFSTTDAGGQTQQFSAPQLLVVQTTLASNTKYMLQMLEAQYYALANQSLRQPTLRGPSVIFALAKDSSGSPITTDRSAMLPVSAILLAASGDNPIPSAPAQKIKAPFTPFLDSVYAALPAGFALRNSDPTIAEQIDSAWFRPVVPAGSVTSQPSFKNPNNVFLVRDLAVGSDEVSINYNQRAAALGGVAVPSILAVGGFSLASPGSAPRGSTASAAGLAGPFGWTPNPSIQVPLIDGLPRPPFAANELPVFATGVFDPKDYFGPIVNGLQNAVLLGVNLGDVLAQISGSATAELPSLQCSFDGRYYTYTFGWSTSAFTPNATFQTFPATSRTPSILKMTGTLVVDLEGEQVSYAATGAMTNFAINFYFFSDSASPDLTVQFSGIQFSEGSGQAPTFSVSAPSLTLHGALEFISGLLNSISGSFLDLLGLADATALTITPSGLTYSLPSISIPDIEMGFIDIMGIHFDSVVSLPFTNDGQAEVGFNFSSPENPFIISVALLSGGGFADITANTKGIDAFDISLQAGAYCGINLADVVQGDVYIFAGIIYGYDETTGIAFTAYLTAGGDVSVLDLITASIDVTVSLTYEPNSCPPTLSGTAELQFEVHVLTFSKTVEVAFSYSIEGGDGSSCLASGGQSKKAGVAPSAASHLSGSSCASLWQQYQLAYGDL
jgi:hypothetical protein